MKLEGKKINFLGDSITEGHGTSAPDKCFASLMKKKYHLLEARNYGIGGTRIARQSTVSDNQVWDMNFCDRVEQMSPYADIVVVFGGTNDFGHGDAPLGQMSDRTPDTFYGACHTLCEKLLNRYPHAVIVMLTPLHRCNEENLKGDGFKAVDVAPLSTYVEIIKEVAKFYALPILDLFSMSGIQPRVPIIQETYCPDGLHPNDAGHVVLADRIGNFLLSL